MTHKYNAREKRRRRKAKVQRKKAKIREAIATGSKSKS
jgi:hypothetical protein